MASRNIFDACLHLQQAWPGIQHEFTVLTGYTLGLTCVKRCKEEQQELYAVGRTKPGKILTNDDGVSRLSKHNLSTSRAVDVAVWVAGKLSWDECHYLQIGPVVRKFGLFWGGDWKHFKDLPHIYCSCTEGLMGNIKGKLEDWLKGYILKKGMEKGGMQAAQVVATLVITWGIQAKAAEYGWTIKLDDVNLFAGGIVAGVGAVVGFVVNFVKNRLTRKP